MKRLHPRSGTLVAANDEDDFIVSTSSTAHDGWRETLMPADYWQRHTGPAPADELERRAGYARQAGVADDDERDAFPVFVGLRNALIGYAVILGAVAIISLAVQAVIRAVAWAVA